MPKVIKFDPSDNLHVEFIFSCANLFTLISNLPPFTNKTKVAKYAAELQPKIAEQETFDRKDPDWEKKRDELEKKINFELLTFLQCKFVP